MSNQRTIPEKYCAEFEELVSAVKKIIPLCAEFSKESGQPIAYEASLLARRAANIVLGDTAAGRRGSYVVLLSFWRAPTAIATPSIEDYDLEYTVGDIETWEDCEICPTWSAIFRKTHKYAREVHGQGLPWPSELTYNELLSRGNKSRANLYKNKSKQLNLNIFYSIYNTSWLLKISIRRHFEE